MIDQGPTLEKDPPNRGLCTDQETQRSTTLLSINPPMMGPRGGMDTRAT